VNFINVLQSYFWHKKVDDLILDFIKAIDELKNGIYIESSKYGPESI